VPLLPLSGAAARLRDADPECGQRMTMTGEELQSARNPRPNVRLQALNLFLVGFFGPIFRTNVHPLVRGLCRLSPVLS
jgi:hypothetical protein